MHTCVPDPTGPSSPRTADAGFLYSNFSYGVAAAALSFGTNLWATLLVGYKALYVASSVPPRFQTSYSDSRTYTRVSRRFVRKHVIAGSLGLQTERVLSLLLESGAFYCAIWVSAAQFPLLCVPVDLLGHGAP